MWLWLLASFRGYPVVLTCVAVAVAAGFHNASLYEGLRCSIPPLVALLRDDEDKTRANAAGALGNLVRNSGLLCQSLIQANALQVGQPKCNNTDNSWLLLASHDSGRVPQRIAHTGTGIWDAGSV